VPFESTTNIYSVVQDKKGFIWLSGHNGLSRFDSSQIINFSNSKKDWHIPFNWINHLSIKDEQLILATENKGLWLFNPNTGTTTPIKLKLKYNTKSNTLYKVVHHKNSFYAISMAPQHLYRYDIATSETTILMENIDHNILLSSENRIYFNDEEKLYYIDSTNNDQKINQIKDINENIVAAASTRDMIVMASKNHLFKLNDTGAITTEETPYPVSAIAISNNSQNFFTVDLSGIITKHDLITFKKDHNTFPTVEKSRYQALLHDSSGVLWLVSDRGIQLLTENTVKNHSAVFDTKFSSLETEVYENQLYIGSYGKGVHTLYPFKNSKVNTVNSINKELSNKALRITDLLAIDKALFIATFDGLWRYNKKNEHTHKVNLSFKNSDLSHLILLKLVYTNDLLYIATDGQGLIIYDMNQKTIIKHIDTTAGLSSGEVIDILPLTNGDIWLATASGIDIIKNNTKTINTITSQTSAKFISLLLADGKIFASTQGDGIFVYNQQGQLLTHFAKGINFNFISLIDNYILASARPGLYKINPKNQRVVFGKAEWDMGTAKYFGQDTAPFCKDVEHALELFVNFKPESTFHPSWGKERAEQVLAQCK